MLENIKIARIKAYEIKDAISTILFSFSDDSIYWGIYGASGIINYLNEVLFNSNSSDSFLVIKHNDKLIGVAHLKDLNSNIFLSIIAIDNNYKNKGIGQMLLDYIFTYSNELGKPEIVLDVFNKNHLAKNWYLKNGFEKVESLGFYKLEKSIHQNNLNYEIIDRELNIKNHNNYGFSIFDLISNRKKITYGRISNNLFLRSNINDEAINIGNQIMRDFNLNYFFLYSNNEKFDQREKFLLIDKRLRLKRRL